MEETPQQQMTDDDDRGNGNRRIQECQCEAGHDGAARAGTHN